MQSSTSEDRPCTRIASEHLLRRVLRHSCQRLDDCSAQKAIRAPSCSVRGSRAPVTFPNVAGLERLVPHVDRFTRLKKLKNSNRSCICAPSDLNHGIFVFLIALRSNCARPGPRSVFRPILPCRRYAPVIGSLGGGAKSDTLNVPLM